MIFDEIYQKKVIALDTAEELGEVSGIYLDKKTFALAGIAVGGEKAFLLPTNDIVGKEDMITVPSIDVLKCEGEDTYKISIGQKVLTRFGKELGEICGIVFGRKYVKLELADTSLAPYKITAATKGYLVVNLRAGRPNLSVDDQEETLEDTDIAASDAQDEFMSDIAEPVDFATQQIPSAQFEEFVVTAGAPLRYSAPYDGTSADYSFLLGRRVEREISDLTRTFSIAVGTIITEQVLTRAKRAGKIVDLAVNSSKMQ